MMELSRAWRVYSWYVPSRSQICIHANSKNMHAPFPLVRHRPIAFSVDSDMVLSLFSTGRFLKPRTPAWLPPFVRPSIPSSPTSDAKKKKVSAPLCTLPHGRPEAEPIDDDDFDVDIDSQVHKDVHVVVEALDNFKEYADYGSHCR